MALKAIKVKDNKVVKIVCKTDQKFKNLSKSNKSKNKKLKIHMHIGVITKLIFLIFSIKKIFNYLK